MRNIHNQNVAELAHCIIVFYKQDLDTCFGDKGTLAGKQGPLLFHVASWNGLQNIY